MYFFSWAGLIRGAACACLRGVLWATVLYAALVSVPSLAKTRVKLACIDCFGTASMYPAVGREVFGDELEIQWIHVRTQTEEEFGKTASYMRGWLATRHEFVEDVYVNPQDSGAMDAMVQYLREEGIVGVVGGMEEGAYFENWFSGQLGFPTNDWTTRDIRRFKYPMQLALGDLAIPTLLTASEQEVYDFVASLGDEFDGVVTKPNGSSAGEGVRFAPRARPDLVWENIRSLLGTHDHYGHLIDKMIVQPEIVGPEVFLDSMSNGIDEGEMARAFPLGVWRYFKLKQPTGTQVYFVDRPIDLTGALGRTFLDLTQKVHTRLRNWYLPGHTEAIQHEKTGRWYVLEHGQRAGGGAMPLVDSIVWGTGHMHMHLLRILDVDRYEREAATFPRRMLIDSTVVTAVSPGVGRVSDRILDILQGIPGYFSVAPHFDPVPGCATQKTECLDSAPFAVFFKGPTDTVQQAAIRMMELQTSTELIELDAPMSCPKVLEGHNVRIWDRFQQIPWQLAK